MRTRLGSIFLAVALIAADARAQSSLSETLQGDAKVEYDQALALTRNRDFAGAFLKFQAAYEKSKDPRLLFNMAVCEKNVRHYAKASKLVKRYLEDGGALISENDRKEAQDLADAIAPFSAPLKINVDEPGSSIFVDDDLAGTSTPLTVSVDIGSRKVVVKKDGFRDFVQTIVVGGDAEVVVDVKMVREVHEGVVVITAPKDALIFLDGTQMGRGGWSGKVKSGGHTLRVTAEGMRLFQSEVVVRDNEVRTIDAQLEPDELKTGILHGFEASLRGAIGFKARADNPPVTALWLDLGYRIGRPTYVGIYGQLGQLAKANGCGTDVHDATPTSPTDLAARYSFDSCWFYRLGIAFALHPIPRGKIDPWGGIDIGFTITNYGANAYDPVAGNTDYVKGNSASTSFGLQLGVDFHLLDGVYKPFAFGPFVTWSITLPFHPGDDYIGEINSLESAFYDVAPHSTLLFGIRVVFTL